MPVTIGRGALSGERAGRRAGAQDQVRAQFDPWRVRPLRRGSGGARARGRPAPCRRAAARTVVRGGADQRTSGRSSKPTTLTGPAAPSVLAGAAPRWHPGAIWSPAAKTAVGGSGRPSRTSQAAKPDSWRKSPGTHLGLVDGEARRPLQGGAVAIAAVPRAEQPWRPGRFRPILRCPSSSRCSVAAKRPDRLAAPTAGTSGAGEPRRVDDDQRDAEDPQLLVEHGVRAEVTRTTPSEVRARRLRIHLTGVARASADRGDHGADPGGVGHLLDPADDLHGPGGCPGSLKTRLIRSGPAAGRRGALAGTRAVRLQQFLHPHHALVPGDTSERPFTTRLRSAPRRPARRAMSVIVTLPRRPEGVTARASSTSHFPTPAELRPRKLHGSLRGVRARGEGVPGQRKRDRSVAGGARPSHAE